VRAILTLGTELSTKRQQEQGQIALNYVNMLSKW